MDYMNAELFQGLTEEECERMFACFHATKKQYVTGQIIRSFGRNEKNEVGIVLSGKTELVRIDMNGNQTILETVGDGGIFGEVSAFGSMVGGSLFVVCRSDCSVLFLDCDQITKRCVNACLHHSILVKNLLRILSAKVIYLGERLEVLSQRSIRDKLLCCFSQYAKRLGSDDFILPFSLSTLADYIGADRSAMMRELKRMRSDQIIQTKGNHIKMICT